MTTTYRNATCLGLLMSTLAAFPQENAPLTKEKYTYDDAVQLWRNTDNAAGLSLDSMVNRGISYFQFDHSKGSHFLVQDGNMENILVFFTERYERIGKYFYGYGSFTFDMGRQFNRSWSDVLRSHHSNPYFSGSSIPGKYDFQNFDLAASLATMKFANFTFGMSLHYKVGDLSRLKDPRSRTNLADYKITPAVTYSFRNNSFGLSAYYRRRKEKIDNITTVQTDPNMKYHTYTGLEHEVGIIGGYNAFMREFVNHIFGAEFSYQFDNGCVQSMSAIQIYKGIEDVWGDNKYSPGKYSTTSGRFLTKNLLFGNRISHSLDIEASYEKGNGNEYRQELVIEKDPVTGVESKHWNTLLTYYKRYNVNLADAKLHYRLMWNDAQAREVFSFMGLHASINSAEDKYNLPNSKRLTRRASLSLEGAYSFFRKNGRSLWVEANAGYSPSLKSLIKLSDPSTEYAQEVLMKDQKYYSASYGFGTLQVQFQFPISIKGFTKTWFIKAEGSYLKTDKHTDAFSYGVSLGLYH